MSSSQLAASLVSSLIWPVIIVVILVFTWFKRSQIAEFLSSRSLGQGRRLQRVRAGPLELEWEKLVDSVEQNVITNSGTVPNGDQSELEKIPRVIPDFMKLMVQADDSPLLAVVNASAVIESELADLLRTDGYDTTRKTFGELVNEAASRRLIPRNVVKALYDMTQLRNQTAHRTGIDDISSAQAREYVFLTARVVSRLHEAKRAEN
jgi:hypothetical protein